MIDSEIVAKYIIEKLISYTVTECNRIRNFKDIPSFCNDYLKTLLTESLNLEFISYDHDITEKTTFNQLNEMVEDVPSRQIYYENRIYGINDYSYLEIPVFY
jgi:hypothetical protein